MAFRGDALLGLSRIALHVCESVPVGISLSYSALGKECNAKFGDASYNCEHRTNGAKLQVIVS